jgi:flagellar biosynthesis protein FlhG
MATTISVASGKGGVGKSVVVSNLGLLLARRGRQVILVDLDVGGADLHILFGLVHPKTTLTDFINHRVQTIEEVIQPVGSCPTLQIIPGTGDTLASANLRYSSKKRLIRHLKELKADIILVDVGAGTSYHALDFFLMADHQLAVGTPDPTSVLDLYRFIKLAAIRRVLSLFIARDPAVDSLAERDFSSVGEILEAMGRNDEASQTVAQEALQHFKPCLILNRTTDRSKVNTLHLKKILAEYVGGDLTMLGEIPDDPSLEQSVRAFLPVVEQNPTAPSSAAFTRIADQLIQRLGNANPS